eukprot:EG_transcript_7077
MPPGAALWVGLLAVGTALGAAAGRPTALPGAASSAAGTAERVEVSRRSSAVAPLPPRSVPALPASARQVHRSAWPKVWLWESCLPAVAFGLVGLAAAVLRCVLCRAVKASPSVPSYGAIGSPAQRIAAAAVAGAGTPGGRRPLAVIFDIDGTLCDSFQLGFDASNKVLQANGHAPITAEEYHAGTKYTTPVRLAWHAGYEWESEAFQSAGSKMGAEFDAYYVGLVSPSTAPFYPHVRSLVQQLGAVCRLGALTNAAVAYAHAVLRANAIDSLFDVVHGADDVPAPKPNPDGLLQCCTELAISPSQAVYVGDSPSDGAAARAAGLRSIGVAWGSHSVGTLEAHFEVVVRSVAQLRAVLLAALRHPSAAGAPGAAPLFPALPPVPPLSAVPASPPWLFLLDRDGVINADVGPPGVVEPQQFRLLPGVAAAIAAINAQGHEVYVVTNQTAVRKGLLSENTLQAMHQRMRRELFDASGAFVNEVLVATGQEGSALLPKPAPDMLLEASRLSGIPLSRAVMIGDSARDREAARAAGCPAFILVTSSPHGEAAAAQGVADVVAPDLTAAVEEALRWTAMRDAVQPTPAS